MTRLIFIEQVKAKQAEISAYGFDLETLRIMRASASRKYKAKKTPDNRVTLYALLGIERQFDQNGGC